VWDELTIISVENDIRECGEGIKSTDLHERMYVQDVNFPPTPSHHCYLRAPTVYESSNKTRMSVEEEKKGYENQQMNFVLDMDESFGYNHLEN
jgi:hypothetical protein